MATHSSVLTERIPGTGQPGGLLSVGSHTTEATEQQQHVGHNRRLRMQIQKATKSFQLSTLLFDVFCIYPLLSQELRKKPSFPAQEGPWEGNSSSRTPKLPITSPSIWSLFLFPLLTHTHTYTHRTKCSIIIIFSFPFTV